jgi:retron-type reverse transcriptase
VIQTAVYAATRPVFEAELEDVSHAFRVGRSVRSAIHQIDQLRGEGYGWIVDADIDGFFDAIPLRPLLEKVRRLRLDPYVADLFELWARCEVYDGARVFVPERGIAQGSVVSPMLANLFLDELDENFALFGKKVVRYCDDFLVLCKRREETAEALELTDYLLAELELVLNRDKTLTTSFEQGFRFLGAIFLRDSIFLPFEAKKEKPFTPQLPQPLDLLLYLELRNPLPPLPEGGG